MRRRSFLSLLGAAMVGVAVCLPDLASDPREAVLDQPILVELWEGGRPVSWHWRPPYDYEREWRARRARFRDLYESRMPPIDIRARVPRGYDIPTIG